MNPLIQDILDATVDGEPTKVQTAFDQLIGQRIMDALETRKREVAASMFSQESGEQEEEQAQEEQEENDTEAKDAENQDTQPA